MAEEATDVKAPESAPAEPSTVETEVSAEQAEASEPESKENKLPHSRVKEMTEKSFSEGYEKAMSELLDSEQPAVEEAKANVDKAETSDERAEAMKVLEDSIKKVVNPFFMKQEVKEFLEKNPDAVKYTDQIKAARANNPNLSWNDAYKLASFDDKMKSAETRGVERGESGAAAKEAATTEKPAATPPKISKSLEEQISSKKTSIDDARALIEEQLKKM